MEHHTNLRLRHRIFFCFSKRKRCSSETASTERVAARRDVSYPLSPLPPLQIANATPVCNLKPGGISISLPGPPLNRPEKPLRFFWTFPAVTRTAMSFGRQQDQCEFVRLCIFRLQNGFTTAIQMQRLSNPAYRNRRRVP